MILFTKEVFLQLKSVVNMHINAQSGSQYPGHEPTGPTWQVYIQGISDASNQLGGGGMPDVSLYVSCASKEDAYRMYNELTKQIVDSGTIPELNSKLMDDVLKGEVK